MPLTLPSTRLLVRTNRGFISQKRWYAALGQKEIPPSKQKYVPTSGTYPLGFMAGTAHAGVKASNTQFDDLALLVSDRPCTAAAVFTTNKFRAAPVKFSKQLLVQRKGNGIRAVIVNSGCANAVTGRGGLEDAFAMAKETDRCFVEDSTSNARSQTLVMSTGVIGQRLPIEKITSKIPAAYYARGATHDHWIKAAKAICTTDTFPKLLSRTFTLPSSQEEYHFAGMTKGAGMIHPNMATLLGMICTDVPIELGCLRRALVAATSKSFNCISVDGDTSTNDSLAILANGAAGGQTVGDIHSPDYSAFETALTAFATDLAKMVVRDGEGATKFVTIRVQNCISPKTAHRIASSIARSPLVKTAIYGKDANWGRILCAIGCTENAAAEINPEKISVSFVPSDGSEELKLVVNGEPEKVDEQRAKEILEYEDIEIKVNLGVGSYDAVFWTCDLSHEYITINGDYRT